MRNIKTCHKCQELNGDKRETCWKCNAKLSYDQVSSITDKKVCTKCGSIYSRKKERCDDCGIKLSGYYGQSIKSGKEPNGNLIYVLAILIPLLGITLGLIIMPFAKDELTINFGKIAIGFACVFFGALFARKPEIPWYLKYGWRFKNSEPSDFVIGLNVFFSYITYVVGIIIILVGFFS
ncbi:hypothetical protein RBH29_16945 [Herbivorax sp. ANBcel31]|uniref:hypothetical protein n=1 Tax=Herbivorax sp. ANBcel31 TaxID=3069754 RepID=UPI0027B23E5A|nr:hypothetical protein [Herbivorax sp. ANBcel31]MDQ2088116.1 hypothetical protein [Herbivorax sp. ANBcel31]